MNKLDKEEIKKTNMNPKTINIMLAHQLGIIEHSQMICVIKEITNKKEQ